MNFNGWEQLLCSYFSATCVSELSDALAHDGFEVARVDPIGSVTFKRHDVFIEIGYESESAPNYSPTVVVGLGDSKFDKLGQPAGVPLWFVTRDDEPAIMYSLWTFASESQLRQVLRRIKVELIDKHVRPLWQRPDLLESALLKFRDECA